MEKEKKYTLKISEKELTNPAIKKALLVIMNARLKMHKHDKLIVISNAEYNFIKHHWSWTPVESYAPKKKDQLKGEVGKYNGKRVVMKIR